MSQRESASRQPHNSPSSFKPPTPSAAAGDAYVSPTAQQRPAAGAGPDGARASDAQQDQAAAAQPPSNAPRQQQPSPNNTSSRPGNMRDILNPPTSSSQGQNGATTDPYPRPGPSEPGGPLSAGGAAAAPRPGSRGGPPYPGPDPGQRGMTSLPSPSFPFPPRAGPSPSPSPLTTPSVTPRPLPEPQSSSSYAAWAEEQQQQQQQQQQQHQQQPQPQHVQHNPTFPGRRILPGIGRSVSLGGPNAMRGMEQQRHSFSRSRMGSPSHHAPSPLHQIPPLSSIQTHGPAPPIPYANAPPGRENVPSGLRSVSQPLYGRSDHSAASSPDEDDDDDDAMGPDRKRAKMGRPPKPERWLPSGGRHQADWYPQGGQGGGGGAGGVMAVPNAGTLIRDFVTSGGAEEGTGLALQIQPEGAEAIRVDVDMFQASKEADNKRKRNANASRRFRDRKKQEIQIIKEQNAELQRQNGDFKKELEDMEARLGRAQAERDFYRDERNRLHGLVRRNPELLREAEQTAPATSPTMWSALPRHASAAMPGPGDMQHHPHVAGPRGPSYDAVYHSDDSSQGRMSLPPVRRRRTDAPTSADYGSASSYSGTPSQSPHQGPQHHITYGPGHPYGAAAAGATPSPRLGHQPPHGDQRLPPLRLDHPAGPPHLGPPSPAGLSPHPQPGLLPRGPPPILPVGPPSHGPQHGHHGPPHLQHPQPHHGQPPPPFAQQQSERAPAPVETGWATPMSRPPQRDQHPQR